MGAMSSALMHASENVGDAIVKYEMNRREFLGTSTAVGIAAAGLIGGHASAQDAKPICVGVIGSGNRGSAHLRFLALMPDVEIPAICDIRQEAADAGSKIVTDSGRPAPETYTRDELVYQEMVAREDLDAVIIATPWNWHTPMAVDAMKAGKYAGVEVPAAMTVEECWALVNTSEQTGVPCMMLENWSFRRDNLAVLNMIRQGLLGDIVHCHCSYSHDCRYWFYDPEGKPRWSGEYLDQRNCAQYPTHGVGPVPSWLDINCGDACATMVAMSTASKGINRYFEEKFGPDHPSATHAFKQGDVVTCLVRTHRGKTIVINNDLLLPRPYDNRWAVQGTRGIYNEQRNAVYIEGRSPQSHQWESFDPYQLEFEHPWWRDLEEAGRKSGHDGTDYLEVKMFVKAVREKTQTPIDVYDSATMSCVAPLSGESIAKGSMPVEFPDFTRGKWTTRKPAFAVA
jgi:predicted dehydrogenase